MAKFRKKPIVIEAVQFRGTLVERLPEGVLIDEQGLPYVQTLEGPLRVVVLDWIITRVGGERYLCKPDIFAATYDPVE